MPTPERDPRPLAEWRRRPMAVDANAPGIEAIPFSLDDLLEEVGDALELDAAAKGLELLERGGIVVATACDGYDALERLQREEFDAVLMDCQMPALDGYATTRALRALPRFASLPVIAMTADAHAGDSGKALAAGMNDQVAKPIDVAVLYATLARWVHREQPFLDPAA